MAEYRVVLTPSAQRQFAKLSHQAREMIAAALVALAGNPRSPGWVELAGAKDLWRIRVRQYSVIYQIFVARKRNPSAPRVPWHRDVASAGVHVRPDDASRCAMDRGLSVQLEGPHREHARGLPYFIRSFRHCG